MMLVASLGSCDSDLDPAGYAALIDWMNANAESDSDPSDIVDHDEWEDEPPPPPETYSW